MSTAPASLEVETPPATRPLRVLHVLDISLPLVTGYTIRSRDIVNAQRHLGMQPSVLSSAAHNLRAPGAADANLDGTWYKRTAVEGSLLALPLRKQWPVLKEISAIRVLQQRIVEELRQGSYDLVHAHSPAICGLAGVRAAAQCKLPFVYEIRAFWEDAAVDQNKTGQQSLRYKATRALEQHVVKSADAVVAIAQPLLSDLRERGTDPAKLFYVPNGVDLERFKPLPRDQALAAELGIGGVGSGLSSKAEPVLGFFGSFYFF